MIRFDVLLPEGGLVGSVMSCIDVLREVNLLARARSGRRREPKVSWRIPNLADKNLARRLGAYADGDEGRAARVRPGTEVLVVPPLMMVTIPGLRRLVVRNQALCERLACVHAAGGWIGGCGTGLWLLARARLLDHQPAPVPWLYQSGFAADFPDVPIGTEATMVLGDRIAMVSAADQMHELTLRLVEAAGEPDLARACRDKFLVNPQRQHLVLQIPERVVGVSRDAPLQRAIAWMEANAGRKLSIADVASAAAVSSRTLSRLFNSHMGVPPLAYLNRLRVERAKMWLETTWRSVEEIAELCGFADHASFRRMFRRLAGMSPSQWRERFTVRTPRAIWKVRHYEDVPSSPANSGGHRS